MSEDENYKRQREEITASFPHAKGGFFIYQKTAHWSKTEMKFRITWKNCPLEEKLDP